MRTVTNYFLVNLSLADLLMSLFNCAFNFVYMVNNDWYFGRSYCTVNNFIANVTVSASVFTLMSITIDRYLAIVRPLKPRITKCKAQFTILIIWSSSLILAIPCLLYSTTITYKRFRQNEQTACIMVWPDGQPMVSQMDYLYTIVLFLTTYLIPMTAMVCCYASMARHLWGSLSIGELTTCQQECIRAKRKVVRMFLVVVSVFGVCWLPYHSYFIYTYHKKEFVYSKYVQHLYLGFYWLAMANAMMNPLIYYCMNTR
ncbi:hypothetical protein AAG570_003937 [Ranatra chinensis]|uniref:G-protein coupled receptors family 1 profile domain-containing protein n=1 Tax=Ranatra chinensis TaxID=642074 RepID=A0ABD0Y2C1_9HEMI